MHRLDTCELHGLEWLVLPFERGPERWRQGPYWCALVLAQYERSCGRASRFYHYGQEAQIPANRRRPHPETI